MEGGGRSGNVWTQGLREALEMGGDGDPLPTENIQEVEDEKKEEEVPGAPAVARKYQQLESLLKESQGRLDYLASHWPPKTEMKKLPPTPGSGEEVFYKLKMAAKQVIWERMSAKVLSQEELMKFYTVLEKHADVCPHDLSPAFYWKVDKYLKDRGDLQYDKYIHFYEYVKMQKSPEVDPRIRSSLDAILWGKLMRESDDRVFRRLPIIFLFNYVMKKTWLIQTRLGFMNFDLEGHGYLKEEWFESYIKELIPTLHQLDGMDPVLEPYYLCAVTRKFYFFLDPMRTGKVKIVDILVCMLIDDILELREQEVKETNWFSKQCVEALYQHYLGLDKDENGMLSKAEFIEYNFSVGGKTSYRLTKTFVDRFFEDKMTYGGEVDFRNYVDFVLAIENLKEQQSQAYFFTVLDIDKKGHLNSFDLHYFYKEIYESLHPFNPETPKFEDVKDEIFDMIKPQDPLRITLTDLQNSGKGAVIIRFLIDVKGFEEYETREFVLTPDQQAQLAKRKEPIWKPVYFEKKGKEEEGNGDGAQVTPLSGSETETSLDED